MSCISNIFFVLLYLGDYTIQYLKIPSRKFITNHSECYLKCYKNNATVTLSLYLTINLTIKFVRFIVFKILSDGATSHNGLSKCKT